MKVKREPTIVMPKKLLADWLAALRSGKFKQGTGTLLDKDTGAYCCLGVLQCIAAGVVEPSDLPSSLWLQAHDVKFYDHRGEHDNSPMLYGNSQYMPEGCLTADSVNDEVDGEGHHRFSFKAIAKLIEKNAKGV